MEAAFLKGSNVGSVYLCQATRRLFQLFLLHLHNKLAT